MALVETTAPHDDFDWDVLAFSLGFDYPTPHFEQVEAEEQARYRSVLIDYFRLHAKILKEAGVVIEF